MTSPSVPGLEEAIKAALVNAHTSYGDTGKSSDVIIDVSIRNAYPIIAKAVKKEAFDEGYDEGYAAGCWGGNDD